MGRTGKSQLDWINAGQALLIEGGINAVKLHRLTAAMGVSTGSFYHHFRNFDAYLDELADYYGVEQVRRLFEQARALAGDEPEARLLKATAIFGRSSMRVLNIAMRSWAHDNPRARSAVERYDAALAQNLDDIFLSMGFDELEAKSRTLIMLGLASVHFDPDMQPTMRERWHCIRSLIIPESSLSSIHTRPAKAG
ncbi:MAG: TetR/AcrR family transcriptional regulator [Pseudomonadota bacterium]